MDKKSWLTVGAGLKELKNLTNLKLKLGGTYEEEYSDISCVISGLKELISLTNLSLNLWY
jgi:hypothetical protein